MQSLHVIPARAAAAPSLPRVRYYSKRKAAAVVTAGWLFRHVLEAEMLRADLEVGAARRLQLEKDNAALANRLAEAEADGASGAAGLRT